MATKTVFQRVYDFKIPRGLDLRFRERIEGLSPAQPLAFRDFAAIGAAWVHITGAPSMFGLITLSYATAEASSLGRCDNCPIHHICYISPDSWAYFKDCWPVRDDKGCPLPDLPFSIHDIFCGLVSVGREVARCCTERDSWGAELRNELTSYAFTTGHNVPKSLGWVK